MARWLVRHRRQHDDLGVVGRARRSPGGAVGRDLPIGLQRKEFVEQRGDAVVVDDGAGRGLGDVAVQAKRLRVELQLPRPEEADERAHEFEQHLVDVEHEQRPRVARKLGDLPGGLGILAHRSNSRRGKLTSRHS